MTATTRIRRGAMAADAIGEQFTQIYNGLFRDPRLTGTAKAVFGLISTHRDGYGISVDTLCEQMKENRSAIRAALKLLEEYGYLVRTQERDESTGRMIGSIYEITDMPDGFTADVPAPYAGEQAPPVENRTTGATSGNAADAEADETETRRSDPKSGFPAAGEPTTGEPHADDRTRKNINNLENTKHSSPSGKSAAPAHTRTGTHAREGDTPPAADDATTDTAARGGTKRARTEPSSGEVKRGAKLPKDWAPDAGLLEWARVEAPDVDEVTLARQTAAFVDYWAPNTTAKARKTPEGWRGAWRNWMRKEQERLELRRQRGGAALDPELVKVAQWTVDRWWGKAEEIEGATVGASKDDLLRLVVGALSTGVTIEKVQQALKDCDRACPPPWMLAQALQGKALPGRQPRPSVVETTRQDLARMAADGTAERETSTPADLIAAIMGGTTTVVEETEDPFDGPAGTVIHGQVAS